MKDLNELFTDYLNFNGYNSLDDLKREINRDKYNKRKESENKKRENELKFLHGTIFTIEKYYLQKNDFHGLFDECEISDPNTAAELFKKYREIGHSLRLRKLIINVDGEKYLRVNFKYNAPELNEL